MDLQARAYRVLATWFKAQFMTEDFSRKNQADYYYTSNHKKGNKNDIEN